MKRRNFLQALGLGGAACAAPLAVAQTIKAGGASIASDAPEVNEPAIASVVFATPYRKLAGIEAQEHEKPYHPLVNAMPRLSYGPTTSVVREYHPGRAYAVAFNTLEDFTTPDDYHCEPISVPVCICADYARAEEVCEKLSKAMWLGDPVEIVYMYGEEFVNDIVEPCWEEFTREEREALLVCSFSSNVRHNQPPMREHYVIAYRADSEEAIDRRWAHAISRFEKDREAYLAALDGDPVSHRYCLIDYSEFISLCTGDCTDPPRQELMDGIFIKLRRFSGINPYSVIAIPLITDGLVRSPEPPARLRRPPKPKVSLAAQTGKPVEEKTA